MNKSINLLDFSYWLILISKEEFLLVLWLRIKIMRKINEVKIKRKNTNKLIKIMKLDLINQITYSKLSKLIYSKYLFTKQWFLYPHIFY